MKNSYKSKGVVYGNFWGGGKGSYPSEDLENDSLKGLLKEARKMLKDGSLDSGLGYKSLIGAILEITKISFIKYKGEEYQKVDYLSPCFIGKLSSKQMEFLIQSSINFGI